ncbi:MAG: response regulator transcription factor [Clostridiales bacterium]|nr:response regulator transcription factor [Clostridiales bacterium]
MINVVIAEDDRDVRLSLTNILKTDPEIRIVGEAGDGFEAVELAMSSLPDLVLMDIKMPGIDGLEAARRIRDFCAKNGKEIKILILTTFYDDDYVMKSQEYGVDGYLLKGLPSVKLANAIKHAVGGLVMLDRVIYEKQGKNAREALQSKQALDVLTGTERKILELIVKGNKNAEIAAELYLSEGTVRNCISSMFAKLGCKNSRELAVLGIKAGL